MAYDSLFKCKKCHSDLVIPKRIVVKKLSVHVLARCSHCKKQVKFTLPLPQVHEWVDILAQNCFRCPKCGVSGVVTRTVQSGDFTKLKLYCSSCQKSFIKVANSSIYSYLMASHVNQAKARIQPAMPPYYPPTEKGNLPTAPPAPQAKPAAPPAPAAPAAPVAPRAPQAPITVKKCSNCQAPLTPDTMFCRKCGVPVEPGTESAPRCPYCGATLSAKAQVCPKCSSKVRCEKCDGLLSANARFCIKCGEPLKREAELVEEPKGPVLSCHFCGGALELEDKICPECGKPVRCPNCSNHLKSGVRFCNKCGTNVSEITMTTPQPSASEEEEEEFDEDLEDEDKEVELPTKTVNCQECGAKMSEIYTFCTICGTKLENK